jgi:methionine salvage enolase-phosphatase E1
VLQRQDGDVASGVAADIDNKLRQHTSDLVDYMYSKGQVSVKQRLFLLSQITR